MAYQGQWQARFDHVHSHAIWQCSSYFRQFVNNGVRRLAGILEDINRPESADAKKLLGDAGEVLRLLASAILPLRDDCAKLPALEPDAQDALVTAVAAHLESIQKELGAESSATLQDTLQRLVLVIRALQYGFSLREPWPPRAKALIPAVMKNLAHLCSVSILRLPCACSVL